MRFGNNRSTRVWLEFPFTAEVISRMNLAILLLPALLSSSPELDLVPFKGIAEVRLGQSASKLKDFSDEPDGWFERGPLKVRAEKGVVTIIDLEMSPEICVRYRGKCHSASDGVELAQSLGGCSPIDALEGGSTVTCDGFSVFLGHKPRIRIDGTTKPRPAGAVSCDVYVRGRGETIKVERGKSYCLSRLGSHALSRSTRLTEKLKAALAPSEVVSEGKASVLRSATMRLHFNPAGELDQIELMP
jgi:hypothetical protein